MSSLLKLSSSKLSKSSPTSGIAIIGPVVSNFVTLINQCNLYGSKKNIIQHLNSIICLDVLILTSIGTVVKQFSRNI